MGIIKKTGGEHLIYEDSKNGCLIAIEKEAQKAIKNYWKRNKGKQDPSNEVIDAYLLIHDEEQNSLKINFENRIAVEIQYLKKFD